MKKLFFFGLILVISFSVNAQLSDYSFSVNGIYGTVMKHNKHLDNLVKGPSTGFELSIEKQTLGEKSWHQFFNYPETGVSFTYINLGNKEMMGSIFALHPYLSIPLIRSSFFKLNMKPGAGISFLTKYYSNTPHQEGTLNGVNGEQYGANAAIGSHLNVFLSFGGNIEIPVVSGFSLTADYAWNHASNGSIVAPNSGINMMNAFVGIKYNPNYSAYRSPQKQDYENIPRNFQIDMTLSGGIRQLYYKEGANFAIGSLALSIHKPLKNWYRMGCGIDAFYDGVFGAVNRANNPTENTTEYERTYITSDQFSNKIRVGTSWQHELIMGRLTAGFHFGLYLYNPIKNLEPFVDVQNGTLEKKGLIYNYSINDEDGWFYTRASAKYSITQNIFVAVGLKTHLQKAEFIEWGLGYRFN